MNFYIIMLWEALKSNYESWIGLIISIWMAITLIYYYNKCKYKYVYDIKNYIADISFVLFLLGLCIQSISTRFHIIHVIGNIIFICFICLYLLFNKYSILKMLKKK